MMKVSVKTGDTVLVTTGKDSGKKGKVLAVSRTKKGVRVLVEGVNIIRSRIHIDEAPCHFKDAGDLSKAKPLQMSTVHGLSSYHRERRHNAYSCIRTMLTAHGMASQSNASFLLTIHLDIWEVTMLPRNLFPNFRK